MNSIHTVEQQALRLRICFGHCLNRLGLTPDSPKLRIIASSASLEGNEENKYLREFFARGNNFKIIDSPPQLDQSAELQECLKHAAQFKAFDQNKDSTGLDQIPKERIRSAVAQLCNHNGKLYASTIEDMLKVANRVSPTPLSEDTIRGIIRYTIEQKDTKENRALLPLRVHYFFKNFEGLWACSNPNCQGGNGDIPIGKLFANRRVLCDECGSRVLELLICQTCGDLFLGGYKQRIPEVARGWYISGDYQMLDGLPEKGIRDRNYETYAIFWPRKQQPATAPMRGGKGWWSQNGINVKWAAGHLNCSEGKLTPDSMNDNGYLFFAQKDSAANQLSDIPKYCPNCGDYWSSRGEDYSPIRRMGTGLEKVIQILTQTLQATIKDESK